jgi:hypothetical protein
MNISLYPHAAATRISRFGMAGLLIAFAGITLLGVSHPAYAVGLIYEGTYSTGNTYYAYENSGTQPETATISMAPFQAQFSHSNDYIIIDAITPVGFTSVNGDLDDIATNLQYLSGSAILGSTHLSKTGSDAVTLSWLPVDLSGINDGDSGLWLGTFEVDFTFYGYPSGYPGTFGPYPEMYEDITFDAQVNDTPEPNTLLLFGSGLLGMAGMLRRKLRRG